MKRTIRILHAHQDFDGDFVSVFSWTTKKAGNDNDVLDYLMNKFQNPEEYPAGYNHRPIRKGDRIEITLEEGPFAGKIMLYELESSMTLRAV